MNVDPTKQTLTYTQKKTKMYIATKNKTNIVESNGRWEETKILQKTQCVFWTDEKRGVHWYISVDRFVYNY